MSIFPSISEVMLAVFAALLSLAISLFLLKIQSANFKSVKTLEKEQKILIAKQSETEDFIRSKLVIFQETQDAKDFLEKEVLIFLGEIDKKLLILETEKKRITKMTIFGVLLILLTIGVNNYFYFTTYKNIGKIYLSELIVVALSTIVSLMYLWYEGRVLKKFTKDFFVVKDRFMYLSNEIVRAIDLATKSIK